MYTSSQNLKSFLDVLSWIILQSSIAYMEIVSLHGNSHGLNGTQVTQNP
jgi:hypothetical protein